MEVQSRYSDDLVRMGNVLAGSEEGTGPVAEALSILRDAVGAMWAPMYLLEPSIGHHVLVADPRDTEYLGPCFTTLPVTPYVCRPWMNAEYLPVSASDHLTEWAHLPADFRTHFGPTEVVVPMRAGDRHLGAVLVQTPGGFRLDEAGRSFLTQASRLLSLAVRRWQAVADQRGGEGRSAVPQVTQRSSAARATALVVDAHPLRREGMVALIGSWPEFEVVGQAASGESAVTVARVLRPDLIVVVGAAHARIVAAEAPSAKIVMVAGCQPDDGAADGAHSGVDGWISQDDQANEVHAELVQVACGQRVVSPSIASKLLVPERAEEALTPRERDVLGLIVEGLSNEEVAARLYLSSATVKKHLASIMEKLQLRNRVQVAVYGARRGFAGR